MKKRIISMLLCIAMLLNSLSNLSYAMENFNSEMFKDVSPSDWFYESVKESVKDNIFSGTGNDTFSPNDSLTRAMYVTIMGRIAQVDNNHSIHNAYFTDLDADAYYVPYVIWAVEKEITRGIGNNQFGPNSIITREQLATFTVRYFDAYDISYPESNVSTLPKDLNEISTWAQEAVLKLWKSGLLKGDDKGNFNPKSNATRAEAAAFSVRINEKVKESNTELVEIEAPIQKPDRNSARYYQLSFKSNGGSSVEGFSRREGGNLSNLPVPYKEGVVFAGWYYDKELTKLVGSNDLVRENITLYAKWSEAVPLAEDETKRFASAIDQNKNFTITIRGLESMTADEVENLISVNNFNSQEDKDWIEITKIGSDFIVSGLSYIGQGGTKQTGFEEGASYKLTLNDERLIFDGFPQGTRDFNFTIKKEDVFNLSLNEKMDFIKFEDISDIKENGVRTNSINISPMTVTEDGISAGDMVEGTFTYNGQGSFAVGDTVSIYEGIHPNERVLDDTREGSDGNISYIEITSVSGTTYGYKTADVEDVLFTPDILPVSVDADTDGNVNNNSITIGKDVMDYSDDIYAAVGLDSQTTVDKGDYISFYEGDLNGSSSPKQEGFALITEVTVNSDSYIIDYEEVTLNELLAAMDMYNTDPIDGDEMLKGVDIVAVEAQIEQQAVDSGFAEDAGHYLAAMALETDSFTKITEDFELRNYQILNERGETLSLDEVRLMDDGGMKVEVEVSPPEASISTNLEHFEDTSGLRLTLKIKAEITIGPKMPEDGDGQVVITLTGEFEEEVHLSINVDGGARWEWWAIFPYIAEYEVTANIDLYNYTGLKFNASIVTKEYSDDKWTEDEDLSNVVDELKTLVDEVKDGLGSDEEEDDPANYLIEKYKAMMETESDWVTLVEKEIYEYGYRIPPIMIIEIKMEIKFVIQANMNISLGAEFWYMTAKRYSYNVEVFAKNVTSDVLDLVEEQYEFTFYVMGTLGLRAGISIEAKVCLFDEKFASVGFSAEAGAYIKMYGYFFYQLTYKASSGRESKYSGALYFELGIYLEVAFEAQAFAGTFSYNPTLYENEWPLWSAGMRENIQDFAYSEDEAPEISMKKSIKTTFVPDSVFEMIYLDLKTGDDGTKIYDDSEQYFTIEMTNDKFSYDRDTNSLTITPAEKDIQLDGQMVISWINQPLAWTSKPISTRINLHWDNLNDGYAIVFHSNGGSSIPIMIKKYGEAIISPSDPVKKGYIFDGWYSDKGFTQKYTIPETMPNVDMEVYAKWIPAKDTPYKIEHYGEILGSSQYELLETVPLTGTTDSTVLAATKDYMGYITPASRQITISPDGSSILRYYYDREIYTLTFSPGEAQGENLVSKLKYGAKITAPSFISKGYSFIGWDSEFPVDGKMPAKDLTYTAQWTPSEDTPYRVEYYVEQINGKYTLQRLDDSKTGTTGSTVDIQNIFDNSFIVQNGITYKDTTVNGEATTTPKITKDGKLIIKVNYKRESHDAIFKPDNGEENTVISVKYQGPITAPMQNPIKQGYVFDGWEGYTIGDTMGTADINYTAKWKPVTDNSYTVKHIREDLSENYPSSGDLVEVETKIGTTDSQTEAQAKTYQGFTPNIFTQTKVLPDGTAEVEIKYSRNSYTVNWIANDQFHKTEQVKYGATITEPTSNPTKLGYEFTSWNCFAAGATMRATDQSYTATWTANQYKVSFESNGGTELNDITVTYDGKYTNLPAPTREGYDFAGWFTASENGEQVTPETKVVITVDQTLWAHWTAKNYSVSFDLNTGTGTLPEAISVTYGGGYTGLPENSASKVGYTFAGWYTAAVGGTKITSDSKVTTAQYHTLYARWTANKYTVTFNANGGEAVNPITVTYDSSYGALPVPTFAGYNFVNWIDENGVAVTASTIVKITSDHELKADWVANEATPYTVRHYQQNIVSDSYTQYGDDVKYGKTDTDTIAVANTYEGFTVKEFSQKKIGGDGLTVVEIYYDRNSYIVNWISEGEIHKTEQVKYGASIQPPTEKPTKLGYVFKAWSGLDEGSVMGVTQQDFTVTWTPATDTAYTVNHIREDLNGEYTILEKVTEKGTTGEHTLASPKTYKGFTVDINYAQAEIKADGSSIVNIFYNRNSYDIAWIANYINYETTNNIKYGAIVPLPNGTPDNKSGYTFDGWIGVPDTMPAQNSSYEASWTANTYTVTFDVNRGNALTEDTKKVIFDSAYGPLPTTTCAGFTFTGWIDINNATVNEDTVVKNASDHSLTATWKADTDVAYTVEHYKQNINDDGYTKFFSDIKFGETDTNTEAVANSYEGFNVLDYNQTPIAGDGSTVVKIYYDRNKHTISWNIDGTLQTYNYRYGEVILTPDAEKTGYKFTGWNTSVVNTMPDKDLSYTATWTANQHKVSFESNGGSKYNDITVTYDGKYTSLPSPTRQGYDFVGWFTASENGEQVTPETKVAITEDQTLWAHWTAKNYNVSFDLNTGTGTSPEAISVTYGGSYTGLPENSASKVGYTFAGWHTAAVGGTNITSISNVTTAQDHTLYARWTANKYTVTFNANGGEAVNLITVTYDSSYDTLPVPTYAGYHFVNWIDENGAVVIASTTVKITSNHELKADWVANEATPYTVRHYQQNIESDSYTQYGDDVKYGKTDTDTTAVANTYEGFTVKEFSQKKIGGDGLTVVEIYYDRNSYTVNWISEGEIHKTEQVKYGASIQPPTEKPTKLGYVFKAWSGLDEWSAMGVTQQDFTATWTASQYNVSFEGNGGTEHNDITVTYDGKYSSLPTPAREGYDFVGWFTALVDGELVTPETKVVITEDQTLWAHWTAKNYSVSFDLNTGTGTELEAISVTYGGSYTGLPENSASKAGYTFVGWYTALSGGTKITSISKVTKTQDHTLYAQWIANQYTIVFEGNGSDSGQMVNQSYTYDQTKSLDVNRFTRTGHTFAGWNTQADGKGTSYMDTASISNLAEIGSVSLYAQWNIKQYIISFNSNGGTAVTALTQNYGTTITAPASPTKIGYTFGSWQKNGVDYTFSTIPAENITLTARWNLMDYTIDYVLSSGTNDFDNPSSYNIVSGNITLGDASGKAGYTFDGWYTDAIFTNMVGSIAIAQGSTGAKTFYAKWEPNTYTVIFHKNIGDGITVSQSFTYDEAAEALTANSFVRNGYSFSGWSTNLDGSGTIYTDKQMVRNLVESGNFNLYAKWNVDTSNIQYELNGGIQATGQITSFTVLSNDIILKEPTRGNGYGFIGWYDNAAFTGNKVTTITKGSTGDKTLYAKWGFAGTFTVTNNGNNTFTITRSGNGTQDSQNVGQQTVYFRTINGSAIGGTHFVHQGGTIAAVTFADSETVKTVTVTEYGVASAYNGITATSYSNIDRTYQLELVSVVGGGLLGSNKVATRTMAKVDNYVIANETFSTIQTLLSDAGEYTLSEDYDTGKNAMYSKSGSTLLSKYNSYVQSYLQNTGAKAKVWTTFDYRDTDWYAQRYIQLGISPSKFFSTALTDEGHIVPAIGGGARFNANYSKDNVDGGEYKTFSFPNYQMPESRYEVHAANWASGQDSSKQYVKFELGETPMISMVHYQKASGFDKGYTKNVYLRGQPLDTTEPSKISIAPMAAGDYKAGETVTVAVVFNEIVANLNGANISGTNLNTMTYAGGEGSNVIYFTGTVKNTCNEETILSGITLSGPVLDMAN